MENISNDFEFDLNQEAVLRECVKRSFLEKYLKNRANVEVKNVEDLDIQKRGVDFILNFENGTTNYIDLKAQTNNYIDAPTPTFCLELSYFKKGREIPGWFLREDLLTTHYMFMWIFDSNYEDFDYINYNGKVKRRRQINKPEDVFMYQLMLANVEKTKKWLEERGLTRDFIKNINAYMRSDAGVKDIKAKRPSWEKKNMLRVYYDFNEKKACYSRPTHDQYVTFTSTLYGNKQEMPVNLVVPKTFWQEICSAEYVIQQHAEYPVRPLKEKGHRIAPSWME